MNKKLGLVLGGGGARGCYEAGAWQAFEEQGIHFDCVAGSSIGAIIGALYVQQGKDKAIEFILKISPSRIVEGWTDLPKDMEQLIADRQKIGAFISKYLTQGSDITPLKESIRGMLDFKAFKESKVDFACMTFNASKWVPQPFFKKDITADNMQDVLIASASCFPAFPMLEMKGESFIDGGYADNLPVDLAKQMGAEEIIAIDVKGPGFVKPRIEDGTVRYFEPILQLGNFLDFNKALARKTLKIGYLETNKYLNVCCGWIYTFLSSDWPNIYVLEHYIEAKLEELDIQISLETINRTQQQVMGYKAIIPKTKFMSEYKYTRLIEMLGVMAKIDPVKLYRWDDFMDILFERLDVISKKTDGKDDWTTWEKQVLMEERTVGFYRSLKAEKGKLPLVAAPLASMFENTYSMAVIWYCLDVFYRKNKK